MSTWRPALRIARRTVRRSLGRSLLVAVLVGLPVAGATYADVLIRTLDAPERHAQRQMGAADAIVTVTNHTTLTNFHPRTLRFRPGGHHRDSAAVDLAALLPKGSTVVPNPQFGGPLWLTRGESPIRTTVVTAEVGRPLTSHVARLLSGHPPREGEVALTTPLADRLDLLDSNGRLVPEASVTIRDGATKPVSGLVESPYCLDCERLVASSANGLPKGLDLHYRTGGRGDSYLVDLPDGTDVSALTRELATAGAVLQSRDRVEHPERYEPSGGVPGVSLYTLRALALAALIVGLGLLEVVLLAGAAFAVGARRQSRDLGLVAVAGGTARQIRRIVLTQGLVLGVLGAALGVLVGAAVAVLGEPWWEQIDNAVIESWHFGAWEIAGAAMVGCVSGVLAAVMPALGAGRMAPIDALHGRFRVSRAASRRTPIIGSVLIVAGVVAGIGGNRMMADAFTSYKQQLAHVQQTGGYPQPPSPTAPVGLVLLGAVLVVAGMVILAPSMIRWLSRLGRVLPLSGRLAVRDAARHRHRTGPATAAIAVAVAGSVVFAFVIAGSARARELRHVPNFPSDTFQVYGAADLPHAQQSTDTARQGADAALSVLPGGTAIPDREVVGPPKAGSPRRGWGYLAIQPQRAARGAYAVGEIALANPELIRLTVGRSLTDAEQDKLADGAVLVTSPAQIDAAGKVHISVVSRKGPPERVVLPGVLVERPIAYQSMPAAFVPETVVEEHRWRTMPPSFLVHYPESATADDVDAALAAAQETGARAYAGYDPTSQKDILLLVAAIAAAVVTLVGVAISVALSAAEGRADLATLAAVGAPARRRRSLAAFQALLVGGLGCVLGLALGTFVSYTLRATIGTPEFVVPWQNLLAVGVVVPLLALVIAGICTPGRLPMVRRLD